MIWNRNKSVCEEFLAQYSDASSVLDSFIIMIKLQLYTFMTLKQTVKIQIAENACDVVKSCDITFSMLSTLEASVEVV